MLAGRLNVVILDQSTISLGYKEHVSCVSDYIRMEMRTSEYILSALLGMSTDECKCLLVDK
jgi:hypothetical protein